MSDAAADTVSDADIARLEESACPTCGSCSGMFTANSMNCLTEALGLALPGNGSTLATHTAAGAGAAGPPVRRPDQRAGPHSTDPVHGRDDISALSEQCNRILIARILIAEDSERIAAFVEKGLRYIEVSRSCRQGFGSQK